MPRVPNSPIGIAGSRIDDIAPHGVTIDRVTVRQKKTAKLRGHNIYFSDACGTVVYGAIRKEAVVRAERFEHGGPVPEIGALFAAA